MNATPYLVTVSCPYDGMPLEVALTFEGIPPMFGIWTSPGFVAHMNGEHGGRMDPVDTWPPVVPA